MRILYVVPRYWPSVGGAQLHSRELVQRIGTRHAVSVATQFTSDRDSFAQSVANARPSQYWDGEICVYRIGPPGLWRPCLQMLSKLYGRLRPINPFFAILLHIAIMPQLEAILRRHQPDILHAVHIGLVYSSETAYKVARRFQIPYVWTPFPHIEGVGWRGLRFRRLYHASDALIAMTNREKQWLVEQGALAHRVYVIPVGPLVHQEYDAQGFRRVHNLGQAPTVLFLGQKLPYKGYRQIVEAAPLVWKHMPDARFVFVGPRTPESERYFSKITDQRVVELPAIVDLFEKTSALAACNVFCMPSTQESLGGVYLEAWSLRKPVIAADIHVAREVIEDGKDGLLVEQEPHSIAEAILRLLQHESESRHMGEAGHQKVQTKYSWEHLIGKMEDVYLSLIADSR